MMHALLVYQTAVQGNHKTGTPAPPLPKYKPSSTQNGYGVEAVWDIMHALHSSSQSPGSPANRQWRKPQAQPGVISVSRFFHLWRRFH